MVRDGLRRAIALATELRVTFEIDGGGKMPLRLACALLGELEALHRRAG